MRKLRAGQMRVIIERMYEAQAVIRSLSGSSYTLLDLPIEWLMEAAVSDVEIEQAPKVVEEPV